MSITGCLADFSLPEIFEFIHRGRKTGLLKLRTLPESPTIPPRFYYLWMQKGCIVAAANRLDHQGLVSLIEQQKWISDRVLDRLVHWCCPLDQSLGLFLKNHGVLTSAQLKKLFMLQVLNQLCPLFQVENALFKFKETIAPPQREMTGLSLSANQATLIGLRSLRNWKALATQLPHPKSGLISIIEGQPRYHLNPLEWQVWEYTKGTVSLQTIAEQLRLPVENVRQIAFRLMAVGLAEEVPLLVNIMPTQVLESLSTHLLEDAQHQNVSQSFVQNLMGFLRNKV